MRPWYASGARALLEARQKGLKPAGIVVVSLIGGEFYDCADTALFVHDDMPAERLDWRMLVNLEVWVWANGSVPLDRVLQVLDGIARARPRRLCLRFEHAWGFTGKSGRQIEVKLHDLDIGDGYHVHAIGDVPELHEFIWQPMTHQGTPIERRLRAAAERRHARGTIL